MSDLMTMIQAAEDTKPANGEPCNHCGWCCLTEVCVIGQELTGTSVIPCSLLTEKNGKHYCTLAETDTLKKEIGAGIGCCAETQAEAIQRLVNGEDDPRVWVMESTLRKG